MCLLGKTDKIIQYNSSGLDCIEYRQTIFDLNVLKDLNEHVVNIRVRRLCQHVDHHGPLPVHLQAPQLLLYCVPLGLAKKIILWIVNKNKLSWEGHTRGYKLS